MSRAFVAHPATLESGSAWRWAAKCPDSVWVFLILGLSSFWP
ncbi:Uncharacterised protein [Vibrio cholerae]|nr:Uncharacterised protein [Vibrio cholerae]